MELEQRINDSWKGIGKLGKIHFVFNNYNMAIRQSWFEIIAIYDGYKDEFIVVNDLYNIGFVKSSREALTALFAIFSNENKGDTEYKKLYPILRERVNSTKELGMARDCKISYIHSTNMQKRLSEYIVTKVL